MITSRQAATRVKRGVALLDSVKPNWVKSINLAKFNLGDSKQCVLGLVYDDFLDGLRGIVEIAVLSQMKASVKKLNLMIDPEGPSLEDVANDLNLPDLDGAYYGFNVGDDDYDSQSYEADESENEAFEVIGQQWVKAITARKQAQKDSARFAA